MNLSQGVILMKLQLPPRFLSIGSITIEDRLYGSGLADLSCLGGLIYRCGSGDTAMVT